MPESTELVAVLVAGLLLFIGLMRYVTVYMKGADARRLEVFKMYENTLIENIKLKGQIEITTFKQAETDRHIKFYQKELVKYKNLYEKTLDKPTSQE